MIQGQIVKILTQKDNDWGRYRISCLGKELLAIGVIPEASIGMSVTLEGYEEDNKYGHQFQITSVLKTEQDRYAGARRFLADGYLKGIGITKANALLEAFGEEVVDMFDTEEGRKLLTTVKGIKETTIENIMPSYEENKKYKGIVIFLGGTGSKNQVEHIYEKYGDKSTEVLKQNPYRLQMDLTGFGFKKTDALALSSGIKADSVYRIMAAVKYVLDQASAVEGHCYLTIEEVRSRAIPELVPVPKLSKKIKEDEINRILSEWGEKREEFIEKYDPSAEDLDLLSRCAESRNIILNGLSDAVLEAINSGDLVNDDGKIYTKAMYSAEESVAEALSKLCGANSVRYITKDQVLNAIRDVEIRKTDEFHKKGNMNEFHITDEQRDAVFKALMNRISIISGGPGRGKTAISEIVAHGFLSAGRYYNKSDIIMLAPTGRAAQRITESTGYESMTAHRAIASLKKGFQPPKGKLVLVDESSMIDIWLMKDVIQYAKDCNIVFVGDVDQLPSVGPGKVLKDMIDSGRIPYILLKEGHRNSGTIARNAEMINCGIKTDRYNHDEHFVYTGIERRNSEDKEINKRLGEEFGKKMQDTIIRDYVQKVKQYGIQNVMLCCPTKEKGFVCVKALNDRLQEIFTANAKQATFGSLKLREGDRVMQTKNDYNFKMIRNGTVQEGVFNGERGTVKHINYDNEMETYKIIVQFDDGSLGGYTKQTAGNLALAYVTTVHKCQGSEADCMMLAFTYADQILLNRSLFYTGETRAKKEFRYYGEEKYMYNKYVSVFDLAVSKTDSIKRNTSLKEKIEEKMDAHK